MGTASKTMALCSQDIDIDTPASRLLCDRLSPLPESIIYRIFSFLDANQTVRLSLVSRRFELLCLNSPYLYFSADFDSSENCFARYTQFCGYVNKVMKLRGRLGIGMNQFRIHWFCKQPKYDIGVQVVGACVKMATSCNVRELDILVYFGRRNIYFLPDCVNQCESLRVLRLNLQMGKFQLGSLKMESVEELLLDSVTIFDRRFGEKISSWWTSLRRLNLEKVHCVNDFFVNIPSLEEFKLSNCEIGTVHTHWFLSITGSSLKSSSIFRCHFKGPSNISLNCESLKNFRVYGSDFNKLSTFKIVSICLDNLVICSSSFKKSCCFCISCSSVKQIKITYCKFEEFCHLKINSSSLDVLTVSDCELIYPDERIFGSSPRKRISVDAERLQALTINSSGKYSYELPLSISAPNIQDINWKGNPLDFRYLECFMSLENAIIDVQPSCQHKSKRLACHCKLFKSSIYCVAMLIQSLKHAKFLIINIWPIEMFFMQNDEPISFNNLLDLFLMVDDSLDDQLPVIKAFLKGLPNLRTLMIECEKSFSAGDPNLINSLGLCEKTFIVSHSEDWEKMKIQRRNAQGGDKDQMF